MEEIDNEYIDWEWPHKHLDHLIGYNYFIGGQFKSRIWSYQVICRVCKKLILATDFVTFSKSCKLIPDRCKTASDLVEKEASVQWQNSQQRPRQGTKEVQAGEPTAGAYTALPANQAGEPTEAGKPTEAGRHREAYPALPACPDAPQRDQLLVLQGPGIPPAGVEEVYVTDRVRSFEGTDETDYIYLQYATLSNWVAKRFNTNSRDLPNWGLVFTS